MDRRTVLMMLMLTVLARANQPPRFDGVSGGEIVLKLKEGPATPVGTVIYRIRGKDSDEGDVLQFGLQGQAANELLRVQPVGDHEADLILIKELDREVCLFFIFLRNAVAKKMRDKRRIFSLSCFKIMDGAHAMPRFSLKFLIRRRRSTSLLSR